MRKSKTPGNGELNDHVSFWIGFLFSNSGWLKEQVLNNPYDIRPNLLHAAQLHFLFVLSTAFHSRLERISAKSRPQDDPGRRRRAIWKSAQTGTLERNWKTFQLFAVCFAVWWRRNESLQKKHTVSCKQARIKLSSRWMSCQKLATESTENDLERPGLLKHYSEFSRCSAIVPKYPWA